MRAVEFAFRYVHERLGMLTDVDRHWQSIEDAYTAEGRFYHDLDHIEEMVVWLWLNYEDVNDWMDTHVWILWAAIYHDFIDPKADAAVRRSANRSAADLFYALPDGTPYEVEFRRTLVKWTNEAIMTTDKHITDNKLYQYLVDADLRRFTCEDNKHADQIRLEYPEHSDAKFNKGREAILEFYKARDPFFYTCNDSHLAIQNIERQLAELRQG